MADFAAHLNKEINKDARPSVFDLLAQDSLSSTLRPAFVFGLRTLASRYPEKLSTVALYTDEIFYFLLTFIEKHYLWTKNASFSEHFYNLRRVNRKFRTTCLQKQSIMNLNLLQKIGSVFCQTFLPYLKAKLERFYLDIKGNGALNQTAASRGEIWKMSFLKLYPYFYCALEGGALVTVIFYVLNLIDFHSISNGLLGIELRFPTKFDFVANLSNKSATTPDGLGDILHISGFKGLSRHIWSVIESALPVAVFFLRFLELWYSADVSFQNRSVSLPIQPPIQEFKVTQNSWQLSTHPSQCPFCQRPFKNPTVLSISGYVFCYSCIYKYVNSHRCCPFTLLSCAPEDLVKLYI